MRTIHLRTYLQSLFEGFGIAAYYFRAPDKAKKPYISYELREITNQQLFSQILLEINAWGTDEKKLEDILDTLEQGLHYHRYSDEAMSLSCYRQGQRQEIEDPEQSLWRKRIQFEIRYGERSNLYG